MNQTAFANSDIEEVASLGNILAAATFTIFGVCGIVINIFVIAISARGDLVVGNFKWFLANLAIADMAFAAFGAFVWPIFRLRTQHSSPLPELVCTTEIYLSIVTPAWMIFALPLTALNRYVAVCRSKHFERLYTPRNILAMCVSGYVVPAVVMLPMFAWQPSWFPECGPSRVCHGCFWLLILLSLVCLVVSPLCAAAIYGVLNRRAKLIQSMQQNQLDSDNRRLMRAVLIQGLLPLLATTPTVLLYLLKYAVHVPDWLYSLMGRSLITLNPLLDAVCTLRVVRSYRQATICFVKNLAKGKLSLEGANQHTEVVSICLAESKRSHFASKNGDDG